MMREMPIVMVTGTPSGGEPGRSRPFVKSTKENVEVSRRSQGVGPLAAGAPRWPSSERPRIVGPRIVCPRVSFPCVSCSVELNVPDLAPRHGRGSDPADLCRIGKRARIDRFAFDGSILPLGHGVIS